MVPFSLAYVVNFILFFGRFFYDIMLTPSNTAISPPNGINPPDSHNYFVPNAGYGGRDVGAKGHVISMAQSTEVIGAHTTGAQSL
jgi:hypothetical protein